MTYGWLAVALMTLSHWIPRAHADGTPAPSQATVWIAHVLREKRPEASRIQDMTVETVQAPVMLAPRDGSLRPFVELTLNYWREGWQLYYPDGSLLNYDAGTKRYLIYAYLKGRISQVALIAKGPKEAAESERLYIYAPDAQEFRAVTPSDSLMVAGGAAYLRYYQSDFGNFDSVTGLLRAQYHAREGESRWGLIGEGDLTVLTLDSTPIESGPQLLKVVGDGTYRIFKERRRRWNARLMGGVNYLTMFAHGSPFGFSNLIAINGGFRADYYLNSKTTLRLNCRYNPIGNPFDFSQRGVDLQLVGSRILPNLHRIETGFNYLSYHYKPDALSQVAIDTYSVFLGYGL